jgi:hypothetical protein
MTGTEEQMEQVAQLVLRISVLERQVLQAKDQIIGDHARNGELLHRLTIAQKNNKALRKEVNSIRASMSWKVGRVVLLPVRILKLVIRKLK